MKIELSQDEVTAVLQAIGAHSINTHANLYFNIRNQMEAAQQKAQADVQEAMAALAEKQAQNDEKQTRKVASK